MNILLLAPHPFFSNRGTPIAVKALLQVLADDGHRLTVLTFHEGEPVDIPNCEIRRIPRLPGINGIRPGFSLKKLVCDAVMLVQGLLTVRKERFDMVHAVEESAFIALAMKLLYRVPFVYDMDSSLAQQMMEKYPGLRPVRRILEGCERQAVRGSVGVIAVCKSLEETARGYDADKRIARVEDVSMITDEAGNGERLTDLTGSTGPIVMYVGNLERYQGIDLLVEAFARAQREVPDAQLVVIGGADGDIDRYRRICGELGIGDHCHFAGPRPVGLLGHFLKQATVLASPRITGTNTAMKVYSYLDSGRPVLATRLPTHTQVLDDEISRLEAPDAESMGDGLVALLEDRAMRDRLAANAGERVRREFSPEAFRRKISAFYSEIEQEHGHA